jgi:hypothetical protein
MKHDPVEYPAHYHAGDGVGYTDAMRGMLDRKEFLAVLRAQVVKYMWRLGHKDDALQDARKARFYLERIIDTLEEPRG